MKKKVIVIGMTNILGGVETFIRNTYLNFDYSKFEVDFLHHSKSGILFENEFKQNSSNIIYCEKFLRHPIKSYFRLKQIYLSGNYDIVHCNACSANMLVYFLPVIFFKKKPLIVMHSHNGSSHKKLRHYIFRFILNKIVDVRYACSDVAGKWMYGGKYEFEVIPNGINLDSFRFNYEYRKSLRKTYDIEDNDVVLGSVGRLENVKNHKYIIDMMKELPYNYKYFIIGEGSLKKDLEEQIEKMNLRNRVFIVKNKLDVNEFYQMFDVFVMPSLFEGLPMVCIEAQTSGLPLILSNNISKNTKLSENVCFIDLNNQIKWKNKILEYAGLNLNRNNIDMKYLNKFDSRKVAEKIGKKFISESEKK